MTRTRTTTARRLLAATTAGVVGLVGLGVGPAAAAGVDEPIVDGLAGPLSIDVDRRGTTLVAETFRGAVSHVSTSGEVSEVVLGEPVVAAAHGVAGTIVYTISGDQGSLLKRQTRSGRQDVLADLLAYEKQANPDQVNTYGLVEASPGMRHRVGDAAAEHPTGRSTGGAATACRLHRRGHRREQPVRHRRHRHRHLRRRRRRQRHPAGGPARQGQHRRRAAAQPATPPAGFFTESRVPARSARDRPYVFEPVPTDVEVRGRTLVVSTLPGGPEDPSLGARGSVYTVDRFTGRTSLLGGGLLGATDVAVSPRGTVYATELFANRVSQVTPSGPVTVAELPAPAALEWTRGRLLVAFNVFESGTLTTVTP